MGLLGLLAVVAACGGGPGVPSSEREPRELTLDESCQFIADEVAVHFKDGAPTTDVRAIVSESGASVRREFDLPGTWVLKVDPDKRDRLREALERSPDVESAELVPPLFADPGYGDDPCDRLTPRVPALNGD